MKGFYEGGRGVQTMELDNNEGYGRGRFGRGVVEIQYEFLTLEAAEKEEVLESNQEKLKTIEKLQGEVRERQSYYFTCVLQ